MKTSADFSPCRTFRYCLRRIWDESKPSLVVIGLNPSTADETADDPTIRRCQGFARSFNRGGLIMLNIFSFRATDPKKMMAADDPIGPANNTWIVRETRDRNLIICAWGSHGTFRGRQEEVYCLLEKRSLFNFGFNTNKTPKHPLYLRKDLRPRAFNDAAVCQVIQENIGEVF